MQNAKLKETKLFVARVAESQLMNETYEVTLNNLRKCLELIDATYAREEISTEDVFTLSDARDQCIKFIALVELLADRGEFNSLHAELMTKMSSFTQLINSQFAS